MKVKVYPADQGGCGFYRMVAPAQALMAEGADVELIMPDDPAEHHFQAAWIDDEDGNPVLIDVAHPDCDVVVLQRPLRANLVDAIEILQGKGVRVVVELDDDLVRIGTRAGYRSIDPRLSPERNWEHLERACELADLVTVSTPALADSYAAHGRVAVLPNFVPAQYLTIEQDAHEGVFVGWSGSTETHPNDLQQCGRGIASALNQTGAQMAVVGTASGVAKALQIPKALACGWRPLEEYPHALAQFDVGIVPLEPGLFNEAKSWLKGLEMAAVGVPFVASPTDEYRRLVALGAGMIAERPSQWEGCVKRLVRDVGYRNEMSGRGRAVASTLTIGGNCERWWEAWGSVVNTSCAV